MRLIDADRLIDDLKHDVVMDQDSLDYEELTDSNREKIQFDKDCKQNAIDLLQNAPTIEPERKTGRWIPCSERLPFTEYGESDNVLATCGYRNVDDTSVRWIRQLYFNGGNWCYLTGETYEQKVYAWMPLPECYQEDI